MVPFWPQCLRGWLCQSPAVWFGRTTLHFPSFLVAEFLGGTVTEALGTRTRCGISSHALFRLAQRCPQGLALVAEGERVVGSTEPHVPRINILADKLLWAQRGVTCAQWLG